MGLCKGLSLHIMGGRKGLLSFYKPSSYVDQWYVQHYIPWITYLPLMIKQAMLYHLADLEPEQNIRPLLKPAPCITHIWSFN